MSFKTSLQSQRIVNVHFKNLTPYNKKSYLMNTNCRYFSLFPLSPDIFLVHFKVRYKNEVWRIYFFSHFLSKMLFARLKSVRM